MSRTSPAASFCRDFLVALPTGDDLAPDFGGQGVLGGRGFVPRLAAFDQVGLGGVEAGGDFGREWSVRAVADGGVDVAVGIVSRSRSQTVGPSGFSKATLHLARAASNRNGMTVFLLMYSVMSSLV